MNIVAHLKKKQNLQVEGGLVERGALLQCDSYGRVTVFFLHINILLTKNTPVRNINRSCGRNQGLDSS